jgi:hypothetical protein
MASYPTSIYSPASKSAGQTIQASHINDVDAELTAIEGGILNGTARLNSSHSTVAALSVTGGSTLATLQAGASTVTTFVAGASTLASLNVSGPSTLSGVVTHGADIILQTGFGLCFTGSASTSPFIRVQSGSTVEVTVAGTPRLRVSAGVQIGAPTGGDKGAGTLNVAGDIYKNDGAYANPDYVFEHAYTGEIVKFAKNAGAETYTGLQPSSHVEAFTREHLRFPQLAVTRAMGAFERGDLLLELVEQQFLYICDLRERVKALEAKVG